MVCKVFRWDLKTIYVTICYLTGGGGGEQTDEQTKCQFLCLGRKRIEFVILEVLRPKLSAYFLLVCMGGSNISMKFWYRVVLRSTLFL